jgi:DNA transformation protein
MAESEFADFVHEQLSQLRGLSRGRFFSGAGFSFDGTQFGMIIRGTLYFVVDDATRPSYVARGSQCFAYSTRKRRVDVQRYYSVPADIVEDSDQLTALARESIRVAASTHKRVRATTVKKTVKKSSPGRKRR